MLGALHCLRQDTSGPSISDYCHPTDLHDVPAGIEIYTLEVRGSILITVTNNESRYHCNKNKCEDRRRDNARNVAYDTRSLNWTMHNNQYY